MGTRKQKPVVLSIVLRHVLMEKMRKEIEFKNVEQVLTFIRCYLASAPALQKHLAKQPSGVSMLEEFGLLLQKWTSKKANPNTEDFRRLILQLYSASSHGKFLSENIHSDSDKNSNRVERPAFSFFGDSTPSTFYTALDEGLVGEGLLSRFTVIQYRNQTTAPSKCGTVLI